MCSSDLSNTLFPSHDTQQVNEIKAIEPKVENKPVKKVLESIRIVVESGVFSLEGNQLNEIGKTIKEANKQSGVTWELLSCRIITSPINNLNYNIIWDGKNRCKKIITKRVV